MIPESGASARATYDALAPAYDRFTADYDHETWVGRLLTLIEAPQASATRVLDVGCGTGRSFEPLLRRGHEVSACDISPAMLAVARRRARLGPRRVFWADMRALPECGRFDLITCLDDAVNYLLTPDDLGAAFRSAARLLRPGGAYVFDTNTLLTHRTAFAADDSFRRDAWSFRWRGEGAADAAAESLVSATVEGASAIASVTARHIQRHHPVRAVCEQLQSAGLEVRAVLGQTTGCALHRNANELAHTKTVFIARRRAGRDTKGDT